MRHVCITHTHTPFILGARVVRHRRDLRVTHIHTHPFIVAARVVKSWDRDTRVLHTHLFHLV